MIKNSKNCEIIRTLSRIKKELTEKQITLTNLFNICLQEKDPYCKPLCQIRPSSAVNTINDDKHNELK